MRRRGCNPARCTSGRCRKSRLPRRAITRIPMSTWNAGSNSKARTSGAACTASGMADVLSRCASSPRDPANGPGGGFESRRRCRACRRRKIPRGRLERRRDRRRTRTAAASCAPATTVTRCDTPMARHFSWWATHGWRHRRGACRGRGCARPTDYVPAEGISFEEAVAWRKRQGFNSVSFIAAFPNWAADQHGATFANKDGVFLRNAWEKFGSLGAEREDLHRGRRHHHRQGHARRTGQPAVRRVRRP